MKRAVWILAGLLAVRLVLMAVTPVFDPSEARYATLAANMARGGDYVVPRFTHEGLYQSFDGKPPLVFQAGGLCCEVLGVNEFAVRLFPLLSALLVLFILHRTVKEESGGEAAMLAVLVAATTTVFFADAGIAMTDMPLVCCVAGALLLYGAIRPAAEGRGFAAAWGKRAAIAALLGAGMLVKGPVALVMFGLPVLADSVVNRRWRRFLDWRWLAVAPVFLAVAVPWFVLVEQRNPGSVWYFFYNENFLRFVSHDYGDKYGAGREAFRGVSVLWALASTLPWSLLPLWRLFRHLKDTAFKTDRKLFTFRSLFTFHFSLFTSFPFLALVVITGFWCLTSRVLIYYLFPVVPLFAAWLVGRESRETLRRWTPWCAGITAVGVAAALFAGMATSDKMMGAKTPDCCGYLNRYSHEFYHGTNPACREGKVSFDEVGRRLWETGAFR